MKSDTSFIAARNELERRMPDSPWHASRDIVSEIVSETGLSEERVLAVAWRGAPEKEFKRVSLPVVLVADEREGKLAKLVLDLLEAPTQQMPSGFLAAWEMQDVPQKDDFKKSFAEARQAVNALDPQHLVWSDSASWLVRWRLMDCHPASLEGKSLGGAIALGVLALLKLAGKIPAGHQHEHKLLALMPEHLRGVCITAQVSADGHLEPVKNLENKSQAVSKKGLRAFFSGGLQRLSAATQSHPKAVPGNDVRARVRAFFSRLRRRRLSASTDAVHVIDLVELIGFLRELHEHSITVPRKVAWKRWGIGAVVAVPLIWLINLGMLMLAPKWVWELNTPRHAAAIDDGPIPHDCFHTVEVFNITAYNWHRYLRPMLGIAQTPYALVIGGQSRFCGDQPAFGLTDVGSLQGVRSLALWHTAVNHLEGAENLHNLRRLAVIGTLNQDLTWIGHLRELKVLVLDSGFQEEAYIPDFYFDQLEDLIFHVPDSMERLSLAWCPGIKRLAVCGKNLKHLPGPKTLESVTTLIVDAPNLDTLEFAKTLSQMEKNRIEDLELRNVPDLGMVDLALFPSLRRLVLRGTGVEGIIHANQAPQLREIVIEDAKLFRSLDVSGLDHLTDLTVKRTSVESIVGLGTSKALAHLTLEVINLSKLESLSGLHRLKSLRIRWAPNLVELDCSGIRALERLEVADTAVARLNITGLPQLKEMIVLRGPLKDVAGVEHLPSLSELDISDTQVSYLPAFTSEARPVVLKLSGTRIHELPQLDPRQNFCVVWFLDTALANKLGNMTTAEWSHTTNPEGAWKFGLGGHHNATGDYYEVTPIGSNRFAPTDKRVNPEGWEVKDQTSEYDPFTSQQVMTDWGLSDEFGINYSYYGGFGGWDSWGEEAKKPDEVPRLPFGKAPSQASENKTKVDMKGK